MKAREPAQAPALLPVVAFAGRPNTGKTTLFNALTGLRQRVANFAGCTVEKATGAMSAGGVELEAVDLPGTFSVLPESQDEAVAFRFLRETASSGRPLQVLCVAEASSLANDLPLALSLKACGYPTALVVNMIDEAAINGVRVDGPRLASETGLPVALVSARHREGLDRVQAMISPEPAPRALDIGGAERAALHAVHHASLRRARESCAAAVSASRSGTLETIARSIGLDRRLFHPVLGPAILAAVMFLLFQSLFAWSQPLMDAISGAFASLTARLRPAIGSELLASLVCDGVIAGVAAVATFVPQIAILFTVIGVLEQSGYLPRAGVMVDRALRPFGLDGKVFLPFLSSFACAIPGVMAARTIPNERRRLLAVLLCPLMTCSARIPVYTLVIAAFVPAAWKPWGLSGQGLVLAGMYALGAGLALLFALLARASPFFSAHPAPVTVLPPYRLPKARELAHFVGTRVWHFLDRAGRVIFVLSLALWFLAVFPRAPEPATPAQQIEQSLLGRAGKAMAPVFAPIGYDWQLSVGVVSSLAAREVFVGTMGTLFALSGESEPAGLAAALRGRYTLATAVSLLLFFAVALQCVSTIGVVRRETGGWKWPALQFSSFFLIAYGLAWAGYRITSAFL